MFVEANFLFFMSSSNSVDWLSCWAHLLLEIEVVLITRGERLISPAYLCSAKGICTYIFLWA